MEGKTEVRPADHPVGILLRLYWMGIGNMVLFFAGYFVAQGASAFFSFSIPDIAYWGAVASLVTARYVDVRHLGGATVFGQPASSAHLWRYIAILLGGASVAWLGLHALALV